LWNLQTRALPKPYDLASHCVNGILKTQGRVEVPEEID
jgi:hypothetical protein